MLVAGISHANTTPGPGASASSDPTSGAAVASAAQRAIAKNPAAASRLFEAGINHANNSPGNSATAAGNNDQAPGYGVGRVAAATQAFSAPPRKSSSPPVAQKGPGASNLATQKVSSVVFVFPIVILFVKRTLYMFPSFFSVILVRHAKIWDMG